MTTLLEQFDEISKDDQFKPGDRVREFGYGHTKDLGFHRIVKVHNQYLTVAPERKNVRTPDTFRIKKTNVFLVDDECEIK
jgi:hypothetical protein